MAYPQHTEPAPGEAPGWMLDPAASPDRDTARRAFLRMVSHELRTPLNSIIGFSEILRSELYGPLGSPQYIEYAGIIRDSGTRLLSLFNNVLDMMRLEGGGDFHPVPEPVLPWLEEAVARVQTLATERGIALRILPSEEGLQAVCDPKGLMACLDHLLHNAIDFTAQGDVIEIKARQCGDRVDISVFNRGKAPAPDDIARLMRPFEQGEPALSRTREGAGLGWPIVRLTCNAMGGEFGVITRQGEALKAVLRFAAA
ncbi:HAMP domain-containing sensor histidine kinase [Asticcacaulis sp. EMRT-3]|uniref:sensor histidine kinase n=1 Tax=Asticcacaulis sp. EMRT-3 TaxID=3040349 RepID=UPI0024AF0BB3|nr:HAMP domain-containing sensor histidine kinase [Asticcacaulis sp. EMRT-3]MDI7775408.1 HAMP domain-containing sensor histidine kinase [Asticcacaulis sp. EMRT-3]